MPCFGFPANSVLCRLEKMRQATTWGIKMSKTNFYCVVVTEDGAGLGVQGAAERGAGSGAARGGRGSAAGCEVCAPAWRAHPREGLCPHAGLAGPRGLQGRRGKQLVCASQWLLQEAPSAFVRARGCSASRCSGEDAVVKLASRPLPRGPRVGAAGASSGALGLRGFVCLHHPIK